MAYTSPVVFASTFVSYASNYMSTGASSTLSTLSMGTNTLTSQWWPGGTGFFQAGGTFSGGTVSLGYVDAIGNNAIVTKATLTTSGNATFVLPACSVFLSSNGGTSAGRTVAINANLIPSSLI